MAEDDPVPHFDIAVRHDHHQEDFLEILKVIRPTWKKENVVFKESPKELGHGLFNTMARCYSDHFPQDSIMVRVHYDHEMLRAFIDRDVEPTVIKYLHKRDCAPEILATFRTGFCYQFLHGEILDCKRLHEEPIWRGVAEELAKIHCGQVEYPPRLVKGGTALLSAMGTLREDYPDRLENPEKNEQFQKEYPDRETMERDTKEVWEHTQRCNPDIVLCHNDTRAENIIWNPELQIVRFVDFEGVMYNYRASEIASHFLRYGGFQPVDFSLIPDEELQVKWLRAYLEKYFSLTGREPEDVTEKDVDRLYVQVSHFYLLFLIMSAAGGAITESLNVISNKQMDALRFGIDTLKQFQKEKNRILSLKMPI